MQKSIYILVFTIAVILSSCNTNSTNAPISFDATPLTEEQRELRDKKINATVNNLRISTLDSKNFKEVYSKYLDAKRALSEKQTQRSQGKDFESMPDADFIAFLKEGKKLQKENLRIDEHFIEEFNKVIPAKKVGQFFSMEQRLLERAKSKAKENGAPNGIRGGAGPRGNKDAIKGKLMEKMQNRKAGG